MKTAEHFDAVVIAGDLLDIAGHLDLDSQIVIVQKYLEKLSADRPLFVCSGNHDGDIQIEAKEFVAAWLKEAKTPSIIVDGQTHQLKNRWITVLPWWDGPVTRLEMESFLEQESRQIEGKWIWLHHAPPDQSPISWTGKKDAGDPFLRGLLDKYNPDLVFCGHIHSSPFRNGGSWNDQIGQTHLFNGGRQIGDMPAHISVDLNSCQATWVSLAGMETVELS